MPDFIKNFIQNIQKIWTGTTNMQKIIGGAVIAAAVIVIAGIFIFSSSSSGEKLFNQQLDEKDFDRITSRLSDLDIKYTTQGKNYIMVGSRSEKNKALMLLAEENSLPQGRYNFLKIIEDKRLTTGDFIGKAKIRAALVGELEDLLRSSPLIDNAKVNITMPKSELFEKANDPVKVAVMLFPAWGVDLSENKAAIRGIEELVVNSIDKAKKENVVITDPSGIKLNDDSGKDITDRIKETNEHLKIRKNEEDKIRRKITNAVSQTFPEDRFSVIVHVEMNFDQQRSKTHKILPVVLKEDDPKTPYDDGERTYSIEVSSKKTKEIFTGPQWIPEGPPGFDQNIPPGYKGALEQITEYQKVEDIINHDSSSSDEELIKDPWEVTKVDASITLDGTWELEFDDKGDVVVKPNGDRQRKYIPIPEDTLKKMKGFIEKGIGYRVERGDKVEVYEVVKDRSAQFADEDKAWRRQRTITLSFILALGAIVLLFIGIVIWRLVAKELERRRRLREEELARQHQLAREMALKSAEEEGREEVEMSTEDRARLEMQENAINMAREHPEDVAQLIRTWLSEE